MITTTATPWECLESERCGWWIDTGAGALGAALREAMALSDAERMQMGSRGREVVQKRFSWQYVAARHLELYDWLNTGSSRPVWIDQ